MKNCLIVDSSRVIRKVVRQILESSGYSCAEAENGQVALDACKTQMPELILLDWSLPVMNGMEFMQALRQLPRGTEPAVVFCSAETSLQRIAEALAAGAREYIMKPFDADIIRGKLDSFDMMDA